MVSKKPVLISFSIAIAILVAGCNSNDDDNDVANVVSEDEANVVSGDGDGADADADAGDADGDGDGNPDEANTALPSAPDGSDTVLSRADMSFFVTSNGIGDGGNLGGLAGADVHCSNLAAAAGSTATEWRAYLSTTGADGVNAIDRIGAGPWVNALGVTVATDVADLLSDGSNLNGLTAVTENGDVVPGRGFTPNRHDILTGTTLEGLASTDATDTTCGNWTSNGEGSAIVGHHDRSGPLIDFVVNPNSFSTAHPSRGCSQEDLQSTGGDGLFYCFVEN